MVPLTIRELKVLSQGRSVTCYLATVEHYQPSADFLANQGLVFIFHNHMAYLCIDSCVLAVTKAVIHKNINLSLIHI